jgi:hypothetical protein
MVMELSSQSAKRLFKQPGTFALAVIKQFRANQGVLLAGAVAYYTLLSLVPLLILILLALSHIVEPGGCHGGRAAQFLHMQPPPAKINRLLALENSSGVDANLAIHIGI